MNQIYYQIDLHFGHERHEFEILRNTTYKYYTILLSLLTYSYTKTGIPGGDSPVYLDGLVLADCARGDFGIISLGANNARRNDRCFPSGNISVLLSDS